jgi:hypothetical protein
MSAGIRRSVVALGVVATVGTASAYAQTPPPAQAPAPAPAPADPLKFSSQSVALLYIVKADKVADFELFWSTVRTKVMASDNADFKGLIEGLRIYKVAGDPQPVNGVPSVTYLFVADKTGTVSYSPTAVLFDSKIFEYAAANELFTKLKESITTLQPWPLTKVGG